MRGHERKDMANLYVGDPHVVLVRNLSPIERDNSTLWVLEFYAGWCGHCQAFSPTWKAVGAASCAWPTIRVGAVDCVRDSAFCQQMRVRSYPTVRAFGSGMPRMGTNLQRCSHGCRSVRDVLGDILHTGGEAVRPRGAVRLPASTDALLSLSGKNACSQRVSTVPSAPSPSTLTLRAGEAPPELSRFPLPMEDMVSAVVYGFERELLRKPLTLGSARHLAFDRWLTLLEHAMPGARNRAMLSKLRQGAVHVTDGAQWSALLGSQPKPLLPHGGAAAGVVWRACRGWSPESRGYPCGLWMLFHGLLAHATDAPAALIAIRGYVEHFFGCGDCASHFMLMATQGVPPLTAPGAPLPANREMADRIPDGVYAPAADAAGAALWMWRAHNAVNRRLNTSGEERVLSYGLPKLQWPDARVCPSCRSPSGGWREAAVVSALRRTYCQQELSACALPRGSSASRAPPPDVVPAAGGTYTSTSDRKVAAAGTFSPVELLPDWMLHPVVSVVATGALLMVAVGVYAACSRSDPRHRRSASRRMRALNSVDQLANGRSVYAGLPSEPLSDD